MGNGNTHNIFAPIVTHLTGKNFVLFLSLSIAACTVGPDYSSPPPPGVKSYTSEMDEKTGLPLPGDPPQHFQYGEKLAGGWWRNFHSPQLDTLVTHAIAGNRDLQAAQASLRQAHAAVAAANGALFPQIDATAGFSHQKSSFVQFGENMSVPSYDLYSLGGTVSYSLDLFGGLERTVEEQQALEDIQRDELTAAYVMLAGNVVTEVMSLAETHDELSAVNAIIAADEDNLRLLRQAGGEGVLAPDGPELLGAESQLAADQNLYPPLLQQQDTAKHALIALLGKLPAEETLPDFTLKSITLPSKIPVSLPSELAGQRPDIRAADARLHAASAAIGIATANLLPDIKLSASFAYDALALKDMFSPVGMVSSIGGQLAAPIFHGGTLSAEKDAAEAAYDVALAQYQSTVVQAFRQIADVLRALKHDAELTESERNAVATAERSLQAARRNLDAGTGAYLEVIDATRQYRNAQLGYIRASAQRHQDTAQLFVALGGGWWRDPGFKTIADKKERP